MARQIIRAVAGAFALAAGLWLFEQLRDPISDVRLKVAELHDYWKGVTS